MTTDQAGPSRTRIIAARILVVLGVVLVVVSLFANFVKREALDEETFRGTSQELIANEDIRDQVAATMVEQLYANVDVAARLQERLPENLQPLAAPLAGLSREAIDRAARELLARPRVQTLFVNASSLAQAQVVKVLEGDTTRLQTTGGNVVLDLHPLVVQLGDRFGFLGNVSETLPPDAGRITILRSDELDTAQSLTQALKVVANWIWIPALLAWAAALWLVPGRRRKEVRAISIGLIVAGVAILVIRRVAGSYLVDNLTDSESIRPAVDAFWTHPLRRARRGGVGRGRGRRDRRPRHLAHRRGRARRGGAPRRGPVARAHRRGLGGVRGRPPSRGLGPASASVRDDGDPGRPGGGRLRGVPASGPGRAGCGGPRCPRARPDDPVAEAEGAQPGRRTRRSSSASRACAPTTSSPRRSTPRPRRACSRRS